MLFPSVCCKFYLTMCWHISEKVKLSVTVEWWHNRKETMYVGCVNLCAHRVCKIFVYLLLITSHVWRIRSNSKYKRHVGLFERLVIARFPDTSLLTLRKNMKSSYYHIYLRSTYRDIYLFLILVFINLLYDIHTLLDFATYLGLPWPFSPVMLLV